MPAPLTPAAELYRDLDPGTMHDNTARVVLLCRDGKATSKLTLRNRGTYNHKTGWRWLALAQVAEALDGRGVPEHARYLGDVVEYCRARLEQERLEGHLLKEVCSTTYWQRHTSLHYLGQWRETLRLLQHRPDHRGLRLLAGELIAWQRKDRTLLRAFRAGDGVIQPVGVRCKDDPHWSENVSTKSHYWEKHVTHPKVLRMILHTWDAAVNDGSPRLRNRPHEALQVRLLLSPEGRLLESLSREGCPVRMSTMIGVNRFSNGALHVLTPQIELIHESPGKPPTQVVWEVACRVSGVVSYRVAANYLGVPSPQEPVNRPVIGKPWPYPGRVTIPPDWQTFGPDSPMVEAPPWEGDVGEPGPGPEPPPPEKPEGEFPWDLTDLKARLEKIRDNTDLPSLPRWARVTQHQALATLDRLGAWKGVRDAD